MKLISIDTDLRGLDCHLHSGFSPDANRAGAGSPNEIADAARKKGLRGFIVTDHLDVGHWKDCEPIDFDKYFAQWERARNDNPDLVIYIGLEVGFERASAAQTAKAINDLPFEYIVNSVHYWSGSGRDAFSRGRMKAYSEYLDAVIASLDAPYEFSTVGHLGFPERYAPYEKDERAMEYALFKPQLDRIIEKTVARGIRFEENTNAGGEMRQPRADFLYAYKAAGGVRPVLGSDAHVTAAIGQHFDVAEKFLNDIFD